MLFRSQLNQKSLKELLDGIEIYPQVLINIKTTPNYNWQTDTKLTSMIHQVEQRLVGKGRVLIRPSGTEPVLRVMVEANEPALAKESAEAIAREVAAT